MTGLRRKARIAVLQTLYEVDCSVHRVDEVLERNIREGDLPGEVADFARGLVTGVIQNQQAIDDQIRYFAPLFPLEQLTAIDRNILRLAIYEVSFDTQVPLKAAVNEAVEIAKSFGGDGSSKFINGVLGSVLASGVKRDEDPLKEIHPGEPEK